MSPVLKVSGVSARHGDRRVLEAIDFEVAVGEVLGIVGPSGAGKTTLLHVVHGLHEAAAGSVERAGPTALVFQRPHLLPWRRVVANASYGLESAGTAPAMARDRAADLLTRLGLGEHLGDYPHQLSEGMQQRVNLARALLVEPDVVLLDEPFSALDVLTRGQLHDDLLREQVRRRCAVVLVSHDLLEVATLCDRVLLLAGRPAQLAATVPVDLPRPRGKDAAGRLLIHEVAAELERGLAAAVRAASGSPG